MKMAIKRINDDFLVKPLKLVNRHGTPKLWAIAFENGYKTRKQRVLSDALKHVSGTMVVVNHLRTSKPWEITHENIHKMQQNMSFWS